MSKELTNKLSVEDRKRESSWKRRHIKGATVLRYDELFQLQEGRCAICQTQPSRVRLNLDHDHSTGLIRGLLCWKCNKHLDHFLKDSRLQKAIDYIEKHKQSASKL